MRIAPASTKEDLKTGKVGGAVIGMEPNVFGPTVPPESAPEEITKAVASLPPEQMFELMKQMKLFILHQPEEARQLLLHNPQLPYALLQAQVVMRIVEPRLAHEYLHKPRSNIPNFSDLTESFPSVELHNHPDVYHSEYGSRQQKSHVDGQFEYHQSNMGTYLTKPDSVQLLKSNQHQISKPPLLDISIDHEVNFQLPRLPIEDIQTHIGPQDPRTVQDLKNTGTCTVPQERPNYSSIEHNRQLHSIHSSQDVPHAVQRKSHFMDPPTRSIFPEKFEAKISSDQISPSLAVSGSDCTIGSRLSNIPYTHHNLQGTSLRYDTPLDPRRVAHLDPQLASLTGMNLRNPIPLHTKQSLNLTDLQHDVNERNTNMSSISQEEKTSLILQVLALTDEQIAQLTTEQRQSIILLKEQIAKQTGAAIQARN